MIMPIRIHIQSTVDRAMIMIRCKWCMIILRFFSFIHIDFVSLICL